MSEKYYVNSLTCARTRIKVKLRPKVIALVGGLFLALGAAQFLVQQQILLPGFADLEKRAAQTDMDRVVHTIARELELLYVSAQDYGNWIDTYRYMQDHNSDYVTTNLTAETMDALRLNVMAFVSIDGHYVWAAGKRLKSADHLDIDLVASKGLPANHPWRGAARSGTATTGLIGTNQGVMIAALAPVLNGTGTGSHRGMLLFGRLLTMEELARIGEQAQVRLSNVALPAPGAQETLSPETVTVHESVTEVSRLFHDVLGRPVLMLRIEVPRRISAYGLQVTGYALLFLLGAGAGVLLLMIFLLNRTVLNPLAMVTRHALVLGQSDDLTAKLDLDRVDEIGDLAREFDRMVDRLAEARRQLVDRSFDAGVAENASGVLHNVGNAMTPLGVQIVSVQQSLRAAPAEDIDLVLAELDRGAEVDDRRPELQEFLRLTSRDLAHCVTDARRELDMVFGHLQCIQQILGEQTGRTRAGKVTENVHLPDLILQSATLVPPELRERTEIQIDESVHAIGSLCGARTTLQQVFQNLIVNAGEAIRDARRERGVLRVTARSCPSQGGETLHLVFADDGIGIAEADLAHVFERGFSTKSEATNSGIGLHWCANAINALGGSIRVESEGRNRGASLHVELPLQRGSAPDVKNAA